MTTVSLPQTNSIKGCHRRNAPDVLASPKGSGQQSLRIAFVVVLCLLSLDIGNAQSPSSVRIESRLSVQNFQGLSYKEELPHSGTILERNHHRFQRTLKKSKSAKNSGSAKSSDEIPSSTTTNEESMKSNKSKHIPPTAGDSKKSNKSLSKKISHKTSKSETMKQAFPKKADKSSKSFKHSKSLKKSKSFKSLKSLKSSKSFKSIKSVKSSKSAKNESSTALQSKASAASETQGEKTTSELPLTSWTGMLGVAITLLGAAFVVQCTRMRKSRTSDTTARGAYKPVGALAETELTEMGDSEDVDAEYGDIDDDEQYESGEFVNKKGRDGLQRAQ